MSDRTARSRVSCNRAAAPDATFRRMAPLSSYALPFLSSSVPPFPRSSVLTDLLHVDDGPPTGGKQRVGHERETCEQIVRRRQNLDFLFASSKTQGELELALLAPHFEDGHFHSAFEEPHHDQAPIRNLRSTG